MRKLNTQDVFRMGRIIKESNIRERIVDLVSKNKQEDTDIEKVGIEAVFMIIENCSHSCMENKIYEFLAGITEKTQDDIKQQSLEITIEDIRKIIKENDIVNFFKSAGTVM